MAESGGLAPLSALPIHLLSKQRPHLGGFTLLKLAESSGPAPQAQRPKPASNRSPHFAALLSKMAEARGHAPQRLHVALTASNGCRHACPISPPKVSATGFAPASIRLEGGGLNFSATRRKAEHLASTKRLASKERRVVIGKLWPRSPLAKNKLACALASAGIRPKPTPSMPRCWRELNVKGKPTAALFVSVGT